MSDAVLIENYRKAYNDPNLSGIRGDLRTPDSSKIVATNVTPGEAFEYLLNWADNQ